MWLPHPGRRVSRTRDVRKGPKEQAESPPRACGTEDDRRSRASTRPEETAQTSPSNVGGISREESRSGPFDSSIGGPSGQPWARGYPDLKHRLSICSALIFDSSVDAGTPSGPAAPKGPATRPLLCVSAASMAPFSWVASVPVERLATGAVARDRPESHRGSIESVSESHRITAR